MTETTVKEKKQVTRLVTVALGDDEVSLSIVNALTAANHNQANLANRIHKQRLRIRELEKNSVQKKTKEINARAMKVLQELVDDPKTMVTPDLAFKIKQLISDYKTPPTEKQKERI